MDVNYIFRRQQMERTLAEAAQNAAARAAHEEMARQYELEIERKSAGQIVFPSHRERDDRADETLISELPSPSASS